MTIREPVRECLEKDPCDRSTEDIDILLEFTQTFPAFFNMTLATRRALCAVMVFAVVEKAGTIVMNDGEELDSWSVIINGEVRIDPPTFADGEQGVPRYLKWGDNFGITPTMEKLYHRGIMRTCQDDCQFVCITQTDYYKILNEGESNQRKVEDENGVTVLVTEPENNATAAAAAAVSGGGKLNQKVIRGTPDRLLQQLVDENCGSDPTYVEDYLLTHRIFVPTSLEVAERLLEWCQGGQKTFDRVTRVLLLWVHNHFTDFEMDPEMMLFLERFESALDAKKMNGQLRMLNFACAEKARRRVVVLTR
jgi:Rap guanine nucleotide exchange factor 2